MTALPIEPTDDDIRVWLTGQPEGARLWDAVRAAHQAGIEAERARVAAEATEEWGTMFSDGHVGRATNELGANSVADRIQRHGYPRPGIYRRTAAGPWEASS